MAETGIRCSCCGLLHKHLGEGLCATCRNHRSKESTQTVKRHQEHEAMLRERLAAASGWAQNADAERKKFGEKMHWALRSRDRTIKVLRQINDFHELRSNAMCKCKKPKCKIAELLDDRGIQQLIRKVDDFEAEEQRKEQMWREIQRDPYAWEDFVREQTSKPSLRRNTDSA